MHKDENEPMDNSSAPLLVIPEKEELTREQTLELFSVRGLLLQSAGPFFQDDTEVVLAAVTQNGYAFKFASYRLRTYMPIVLSALCQNLNALWDCPDFIRERPEVLFLRAKHLYIKDQEWSLVKLALLEKPDHFLNPEPYMQALADCMEHPYLMLAEYALNKDMAIEPADYPEIML